MTEERRNKAFAENDVAANPRAGESASGPAWRSWAVSILAAILISVAATLLLGGGFPFGGDDSGPCCRAPRAACCTDAADAAPGGR